jgi:uncharacterized protein (DUF433 family)
MAVKLIPLGEGGVYTVSDVCRILQPSMTPRKVHYWLDTNLLTDPITRGRRGEPTLLSFRQLLEVRTVQRLRDDLAFSLPRVRGALAWILANLFDEHWRDLHYSSGVDHRLVARTSKGEMVIAPGGQGVLDLTVEGLNRDVVETRHAWEEKLLPIPGRPHLVTTPRILAGSPTIAGSRVDTALIASFATAKEIDPAGLAEVIALYPHVPREGIEEAFAFEGVRLTA